MANQEHLEILKQGVEAWNRWREMHPLIIADLSGASLRGANLRQANLKGASLISADLSNADIRGADFGQIFLFENLAQDHIERVQFDIKNLLIQLFNKFGVDISLSKKDFDASFQEFLNKYPENPSEAELHIKTFLDTNVSSEKFANGIPEELSKICLSQINFKRGIKRPYSANLSEASFFKADLRRANLSYANLSGANLRGAQVSFANFTKANLNKAHLSVTNLSYTNLLEANLSGVDFGESDLRQLDLRGTDLSGANLSKAILFNTNLSDTNLRGANLSGVDFSRIILRSANSRGLDFRDAKLSKANLRRQNLIRADLRGADLSEANLNEANLEEANFQNANLREANLKGANLNKTDFHKADLSRAHLNGVDLSGKDLRTTLLREVDLSKSNLSEANLSELDLRKACLREANLLKADLSSANLSDSNLSGANLNSANLVRTILERANLTDCSIHGISAWNVQLEGALQLNLVITTPDEPTITIDNLEVAQFTYLLLDNKNIRNVIDTIAKKAVLILGRFTPERKAVLDAIREMLRQKDYLPILFDFDKPASRDITETVSTLAHLSRFVIADITDAKSIPQELMVIVPNLPSVPVQPLLLESQREYGMFEHFTRFPWVLPVYHYMDQAHLLATLKEQVIELAEQMAQELAKQ